MPHTPPRRRARTYHGVSIGILMVNTRFTRFPGDIGNARTWSFPVQYRVIEQARPADMVDLRNRDLLEPFRQAALELVAEGVDGIATTCGLLALYQRELAETCGVPVATSALLQVPMIERLIPAGRRVGVLTYSPHGLHTDHLEAVGVASDTPILGVSPDSTFFRWIDQGLDDVPFAVLETEVRGFARQLVELHPELGAVVCECTNLTPFSAAIAEETGLPVYDMVTLLDWFHGGLRPASHHDPKGSLSGR